AGGDQIPPTVSITAPVSGGTLSGVVTVSASASDNIGVAKVEFYVDSVLRAVDLATPYQWDFDTSSASNGSHTLEVWAYDIAGNTGRATLNIPTQNDTSLSQPTIPQHYSHIRIAELAFTGTPFGTLEDQLLANSVDLVTPAPASLTHIH